MSSVDASPNSDKKRISGSELARDVRAGMEESLLLAKYSLSHDQLQRALGKLVSAGLLTETELQATANGDPELTMTISTKVCPICSQTQSEQATECSKCGVVFNKVRPDIAPEAYPEPESPAAGRGYVVIAGVCACLVVLLVVLVWTAVTARKEARVAYDEVLKQQESRRAAELEAEDLQQREQTLLDREYDIKQAEYGERVNGALSALSMAGQRWTEEFDRKLAAYNRFSKQQALIQDRKHSQELRAQRMRSAVVFRMYAAIVRDIQNLGIDYRTRSLSRNRARGAAKSLQSKLFILKTYPAANPVVVRRLEAAAQHLMAACQSRRFSDARGNIEDFWSEANAAVEIMSKEISAART